MPTQSDWTIYQYADGTLTVSLAPAANIGGWSLRCQVVNRFGGVTTIVTKTASSGYGGGQSGITVTNSGQGVINVALNSVDLSGQNPGQYCYEISRMDSGSRTPLANGYINL